MTQTTLQAYRKEIEQLIDDNRLTEAIAHCKHLLRQHPRYIEAYRLLGKALLEQHEYTSAADIFQRILSADPEDFVSHVGLSIIYKAEELINEAIWHMERAYETQPYNNSIQHELRDLYAWRDGELKTRELHLTPTALARLHFNAELYQPAIGELRAILKEQPDRVDVLTLLIEALWRDDQRVDAVELCLQLLEILPYCIKANAILSEIWLMTGRIDEAQEYLQKLHALVLPTTTTLNEDTPVSHAFRTDGAIPVPHQIPVEKLDRVSEEEVTLTGIPDWVDELGLSADAFGEDAFGSDDSFAAAPSATEHTPDWLRALTTPSPQSQSSREPADVLDWLRDVAVGDEPETLTLLDDLPSSNQATLATEAPLPDWLSEVLDEDMFIPPIEPHQTHTQETGLPQNNTDDDAWLYDNDQDAPPGIPDWMQESNGAEELHAPIPYEELAPGELPHWLRDESTPTSDDSLAATGHPDWLEDNMAATPPDDHQLSDWLDSLAEEAPQKTKPGDDLPDWFDDLTTMSAAAASLDETDPSAWTAGTDEPVTDTQEDVAAFPSWLSNLSQAEEQTVPRTESTDLPDWLAGLTPSEEPVTDIPNEAADLPDWAANFSQTDEPDTTLTDESDLPDWVANFGQMDEPDAPPSDEADLPDWIANFSQTDEPDTDTSDESDLPDWAANFGQTDEPDATPSDEADLPDWAANLGQTDEPDATPSDEADLPDWAANLGQTDEPDATPSDEADLPDWLSGLTQTEEPLAAAASFVQGDSEADLPDWLHTLEQFHETSDISPAPLDDPTLEDSTLPSLPLELTADPLISSAAAMETTIMADPTMQDPNRPPNDDPDNELDWLDELINLPTDEPLTVPEDTSDEIDAIADDWPADNDPSEDPRLTTGDWLADDALPDDADHAWLDALSPTDEIAGQDLDWLDSFDQAEVEESPTLSWLSEDDLHGQASNVYPTEETGSGEDLAEAMAWLESLVPEQKTPSPTVEMDDSLTWLDQLAPNEADAAPSIESGYHSDPQDESPTIVESISTLDDPLLDDLFQLDDDTSAADMADSISWLDELAAAPTTPSSPTNNLFHAGPPPDDPEAAMAWLEQLAAAQAAEDNALFDQATTDDDLEPASGWLEQVGDDADLPDIEASWVPTPTADQPAEANWLDLLSETEANLPADQPLPNWLDELTDESADVIIPGESLFADPSGEQSAEVPLDWLDELAAADDAVLPEQTDGESVPNWFDELPDFTTDEPAPTEEPPQLSNEQAETTTLDPLQPTYVPPTNISPEAAKILDMSDLFEMGEVEESEEDMAQAMAWMNELIGDLGTPTPPPTDEPGEPEPAAETSLTWLDELATTPTDELETETVITYTPDPEPVAQPVYVPPTDISPEAAKILDMSDLFEMGDVEESEEDMAQAMAWMNELIGDLGTPAAAASLAAIAPEPTVSEIEAAAEPVDWLDDLTDEIPSLPEAVLEEPPTPPTSPIAAAAEDAAMAWLDEIVADISDEPVAAASSPTETDEALDWLNEIVADMEGETPASEPDTPATSLVEEAASTPEPTPSPASPVYTPPTDISAEAAKILDMSDLFALDDVEESEEDMAQAMAWMNELIGDTALTPPAAETPVPQIEDDLPVTIVSATPVVEDDSALNWLDSLATQDQPIAVLPDLDKPFSVDDLNPEPVTPQDEQAALAWLEQMADEQAEDLTAISATMTPSEDDLLAELADFPEDPDKAMDWLDQMAAQQSDGTPASVSTAPVVSEPPTPAVPVAVMDALVEVETKREKAKTGPLKPPPTPPTPEPTDEDELPFSLITELAAGDVTESLPDWLSLDAIESEEMSLSWLSGRDLDATGWLEAEAEMAEAEPVVDLPFITPTEPIRDEPPPRRAPEPVFVPPADSSFTFQANLDVGMDDKQFAAARQLLQQRQYQEAMQTYSSLLESSPAVSPIITELEGAVDSHPAQPLLRRLLGDAYMRNGQLQKALETYRKALDQL